MLTCHRSVRDRSEFNYTDSDPLVGGGKGKVGTAAVAVAAAVAAAAAAAVGPCCLFGGLPGLRGGTNRCHRGWWMRA